MRSGTKLRLVVTVLATPFLVIGYLNIEKLAESRGWDGLLTGLVAKMPADVAGFFISPLMAMASSMAIGVVVGLWLDTFLRQMNNRGSKVQNLGFRVLALASTIDGKLKGRAFDSPMDHMAKEVSMCVVLGKKMEDMGFVIPINVTHAEPIQNRLRMFSRYFKMVGPQMVEASKKDAVEFSKVLATIPEVED